MLPKFYLDEVLFIYLFIFTTTQQIKVNHICKVMSILTSKFDVVIQFRVPKENGIILQNWIKAAI